MAGFITATLELDLWLYVEFEVLCYCCRTPLTRYSDIFVCDTCSTSARRLCSECVTRRKSKNQQQFCGHAKHIDRIATIRAPATARKVGFLA